MPNDEGYDIKLERAVKAIDVMKKLGEVFRSTNKIISEPITLTPEPYLYEISEKLDKVLANQVIIIADIRVLEKKING